MKCRQVLEALSDYVDDNVDSDQGDEIDLHLESCPTCKASLNTFQRTIEFCRDTTVPPLEEAAVESIVEEAGKRYREAIGEGK